MAWVVDYQRDLLCDVLRFCPQFGMEPLRTMPGPVFFSLAPRLAAYGGVMACRFQELVVDTTHPSPAPASAAPRVEVVDVERFCRQHPDIVERVTISG